MRTFYASLFVMLFALTASAQTKSAYSLYVENQTPCTQYYAVFGDEVCQCGTSYSSIILTIAPFSSTTYVNSTFITGFPATPKGIVGAKILDGPTFCNPNGGVVGEINCGFPASYGYMAISANNCTPCVPTKAVWYPPMDNCEQMAKLIFAP